MMNTLSCRIFFLLFTPMQHMMAAFGVWFLCQMPACLQAQPTDLYFHHLDAAQGLSQSTVSSIYRDQSGFVWIGTADGLNRFDGLRVKVYRADTDAPNQLADPTVTGRIFEDKRGDLWFCTHTAIHQYRRQYDDFQRFTIVGPDNTPLKGYQAYHLDAQQRLWVHCNGQLYWLNVIAPNPADLKKPVMPLSASGMYCFDQGMTGILFASTPSGLVQFRYDKQGVTALDTLLSAEENIRCVQQDADGTIWAGGTSGLWRQASGQAFSLIAHTENMLVGRVRCLEPWGTEYLFVATDYDLLLLDKTRRQFIRRWTYDARSISGLSGNNLSFVYVDSDDNLWAAAWTKGVDYTSLRKLKFQTRRYYTNDAQGNPHLFVPGPLLEDSGKRIWCGSQMNGLLALQPDGSLYGDFSRQAPSPDQLFELNDGRLLINNFREGLLVLDPKSRKTQVLLWNGAPVSTYSMCRLDEKTFVIASGNGRQGLLKLAFHGNGYEMEPFGSPEITSKDWYYITSASNQELLVADENYTVFHVRPNQSSQPQKLVSLPGFITCSEEEEQAVWLGGAFGMCRIDKTDQTSRMINMASGLPDNMVYAMLQTNNNEWWLSTGKGLVQFNAANTQFQSYGLADGLQGMEYNRRSSLRTSDGKVWFGGVGGYNSFTPSEIQKHHVFPKVQIIDIQVNDEPYPFKKNPVLVESLRLPYDSATLTFHFVALEFSDPGNNRLRYRLDFSDGSHYDQSWVDCADARGFARYANLPPGRYVLNIIGSNSDGVWSPTPRQISIQITPPFYQTWWFATLSLVLALLLLYVVYRTRMASIRSKEEQKRRMIELELNALRAQLNPHFISNNLISINNYIRHNGVEKVRGYVATFANLMRSVLESARQPVVPLADELNMLRYFVEVESGRFPQPIEFSIEIEEGLDVARFHLPGMLLQPFLENAIIHGLGPRNGVGSIRLSISMAPHALVFVIEDNGVGRREKITPGTERKSHGLEITRERLNLYDLQHHTHSSLQMEDLTHADGSAAGTRITLRLGMAQHSI